MADVPTNLIKSDTWTYGDSTWGDVLTAYNSVSTNATNGKVTTLNGKSISYSFLGLISDAGDTHYSYDTTGRRLKKTTGSTVTQFYYAGDLLVGQKTGNNKIEFIYDSNGDYYGFEYNDVKYYYVKNLQGDVIAIYNNSGTKVATYEYDAWGRLLSSTDTSGVSIGTINPIRYRSYYYDTETGFYYLNTRYYSPELCRFLSPDSLIDNRSVNTQNLFSYCANNPVNNTDITGMMHVKGTDACGGAGSVSISVSIPRYQYNNTFSVGFCASYTAGTIMAGGAAVYSFDDSNNCAIQVTKTTGSSFFDGASGGICISYTNANSIFDLDGASWGKGFEVATPFGIGVEVFEFYPQENAECFGVNIIIPIGASANVYNFDADTTTRKSWRAPFETFVEYIFSIVS